MQTDQGTPTAGAGSCAAAGSAHFVVVDVVGEIPIKKGPILSERVLEYLRELRRHHPTARLTVVCVRSVHNIWIYSEREWLYLHEPPNATKLSHGAEEGGR